MRALVLTSSAPPVPGRDVEGYYKRLKLLMGAVGQFAGAVEIVHIVPEDTARAHPDPAALDAEQSRQWGFPVSATLLATQEREKNFLNYYVRGVFSAAEQPAFLGALGPQGTGSLAEILDRGHDLVFVHRLAAMCALLRTGRRCRNAVFDLDDVEHQMKLRALLQPPVQPGKLISLSHIPALMAAEWRGAARSRRTFVCSEVDRRKLLRLGFGRGVTVVPNAVDIPQDLAAPASEPTLMYIGDFGYAPNREAAERLALRILPIVRQAAPDARLLLAGKRSDQLDPAAAAQPGVERLGFVADLAQLYAGARVVCCPLLNGGGTRVKLIEGAAHGKPMVSTRVGAEGLSFAEGTEILLRDDDAGFAEACVRLIGDDELCRTLGGAARAKAIQDYRIDRIQAQVVRLLRDDAA